MSRLEGPLELSQDINKEQNYYQNETKQGIVSPLLPELTLDVSDEDLIDRAQTWTGKWKKFEPRLGKRQVQNERYWSGKQYSELDYPEDDTGPTGDHRPLVDNKLFEATETFLPIATRANPEPVVECPDEGVKQFVLKKLVDMADVLRLKLKVKAAARTWLLYFVGVVEYGWDEGEDRPKVTVVRPQKCILDPDATVIDGVHYTGSYIGTYQKDSATDLSEKFPEQAEWIADKVEGKMGTELQYVKWCTDDMVFWTLDDKVLGKMRNPHWNYDEQTEVFDDYGNGVRQVVPGKNHFRRPQMPYSLLSIFNLGNHPVDETNPFYQNLAMQDLINKRLRQGDRNNDNVNGGWAISGAKTGMTKDQATEAVAAWRDGGAVFVPDGSVSDDAVKKMIGQPLPPQAYEQLVDARIELSNIFGTRGSTPQGVESVETVRGKILAKGADDSRIGGGVSEYLEQLSDQCFNWILQMLFVYDPEFAALVTVPVRITVKEGSLIPKDALTVRNEAVELASAGLLSPIDLYKRLDDPNPEQTYNNLLRWKIDQVAPQLMQEEASAGAQMQRDERNNQSKEKAAARKNGEQQPVDPSNPNLLAEVPIQ